VEENRNGRGGAAAADGPGVTLQIGGGIGRIGAGGDGAKGGAGRNPRRIGGSKGASFGGNRGVAGVGVCVLGLGETKGEEGRKGGVFQKTSPVEGKVGDETNRRRE
jgi:hypothetical protein